MNAALRWSIGVCTLLSLVPVWASAAGPLTWGVKGGMVLANLSPKEIGNLTELKWKRGPSGGVFASWGLSDQLAVQGQVLYVSKGLSYGEGEGTDEAGNPTGTFEILQVLDYVEIPVLLQATWPTPGPVRPMVVGGPAVAFKVSERFKTTGANQGSEETDRFKSTDFGLAWGVGVQIRSGPGWSLIEARYTYGLVDVANFVGQKEKNRALLFMVGYAF